MNKIHSSYLLTLIASFGFASNAYGITNIYYGYNPSPNDSDGYFSSIENMNDFVKNDVYEVNVLKNNAFYSDLIAFGKVDTGNTPNDISELKLNLIGLYNDFYDDVIGLWHNDDSNSANVTGKVIINMSSGNILDDLFATRDASGYSGNMAMRDENIINISGGIIANEVNGGSGARKNSIYISGGQITSGNIHLGDPDGKNQSLTGQVTLSNLVTGSDFLQNFKEETSGNGIIDATYIAGNAELNFVNLASSFYGGIKDFDTVNIDKDSDVTFNGSTYIADVWNISGQFRPLYKTLKPHDDANITFNVLKDAIVHSSFNTTEDITINNKGVLNGVSAFNQYTDGCGQLVKEYKKITVTNEDYMQGIYEGNNVEINTTKTGIMSGVRIKDSGYAIINNKGTSSLNTPAILANALQNGVVNNSGGVLSHYYAGSGLQGNIIEAPNFDVNNENGGLIAGGIIAKDYSQDSSSTYEFSVKKNENYINKIFLSGNLNIAQGANLNVIELNPISEYTDGQKFLLVTANNMTDNDIQAQLENFAISDTGSPFSGYSVLADGGDGYLVFNNIPPETYSFATNLATTNHTTTVNNSHRFYDFFTNRESLANTPISFSPDDNEKSFISVLPMVGMAHQDGNNDIFGYYNRYYGAVIYGEHNITRNLKAGLGFGFLHNRTDFKDNLNSDAKTNSYRPFAFLSYDLGLWNFEVAAGYAKHKITDKRNYKSIGNTYSAKAKYDADEISGNFNVGYTYFLKNNFVFQPKVGIYASKLKTDAYSEAGNGPLNMNVEKSDYESYRSMVGFKLEKDYILDNMKKLTPEIHVKWFHELGDNQGSVGASFANQGVSFNATGLEMPKDIGDVALRLSTSSVNRLDYFVEGYYQFGENFYNVGAGVGLQYNF